MRTSSAKAKGRRLQDLVVKKIINSLPSLTVDDVKPAIMGESGVDVKLSAVAKKKFPFAVECKNQERWSVNDWWKQTIINAQKEKLKPLLVIKKNHQEPLVIMRAEDFFNLLR